MSIYTVLLFLMMLYAGGTEEIPLPSRERFQTMSDTLGFWFQAKTDFYIHSLYVDSDRQGVAQTVEIIKFNNAPRFYPSTTQGTVLFYEKNNHDVNVCLPASIKVNRNDYIGIVGGRVQGNRLRFDKSRTNNFGFTLLGSQHNMYTLYSPAQIVNNAITTFSYNIIYNIRRIHVNVSTSPSQNCVIIPPSTSTVGSVYGSVGSTTGYSSGSGYESTAGSTSGYGSSTGYESTSGYESSAGSTSGYGSSAGSTSGYESSIGSTTGYGTVGSTSGYESSTGSTSGYESSIGSTTGYESSIGSTSGYGTVGSTSGYGTVGSTTGYESSVGSTSGYESSVGSTSGYGSSVGSTSGYESSAVSTTGYESVGSTSGYGTSVGSTSGYESSAGSTTGYESSVGGLTTVGNSISGGSSGSSIPADDGTSDGNSNNYLALLSLLSLLVCCCCCVLCLCCIVCIVIFAFVNGSGAVLTTILGIVGIGVVKHSKGVDEITTITDQDL